MHILPLLVLIKAFIAYHTSTHWPFFFCHFGLCTRVIYNTKPWYPSLIEKTIEKTMLPEYLKTGDINCSATLLNSYMRFNWILACSGCTPYANFWHRGQFIEGNPAQRQLQYFGYIIAMGFCTVNWLRMYMHTASIANIRHYLWH